MRYAHCCVVVGVTVPYIRWRTWHSCITMTMYSGEPETPYVFIIRTYVMQAGYLTVSTVPVSE